MKFSRIKETCIYTTDLIRAQKFYSEILELPEIGLEPGRHVFFRAGDSVLLIFNPLATSIETRIPPHDGYGRVHFALEASKEDYDAIKKKMAAKGVQMIQEIVWGNGARSFYFHDPDSHLLEIVEEGMWDR